MIGCGIFKSKRQIPSATELQPIPLPPTRTSNAPNMTGLTSSVPPYPVAVVGVQQPALPQVVVPPGATRRAEHQQNYVVPPELLEPPSYEHVLAMKSAETATHRRG